MSSTPSTVKNTTFLARYEDATQSWVVMDVEFNKLTVVGSKDLVEMFVQQFCQLNYSDQDKQAARIYWSEYQRLW